MGQTGALAVQESMMNVKQVAVDQGVHARLKERARDTGMKLRCMTSKVLGAWLDGRVYSCPELGGAATPSEAVSGSPAHANG